jgi:uncharacterized integral membrane protein
MTQMKNAKLIITAVIVLLLVVVIAQNLQVVEVKFLFLSAQIPWAASLIVAILLGFVAGLFWRK